MASIKSLLWLLYRRGGQNYIFYERLDIVLDLILTNKVKTIVSIEKDIV